MLIDDLIDMDAVGAEITAGYVTERAHPEFPELRILNYTDRCQFDRHWTDITRLTRGIIYNAESRQVLARPFPKFYNYGEPEAGVLDLDAEPWGVLDKLDGSLGIQYTRPDGAQAIATRGSFVSEQAIWASQWFERCEAEEARVAPDGTTQLWEIIYPKNRIVVDYGIRAELVFLGWVHHATGTYDYPIHPHLWEVSVPELFTPATVREAFALPPRPNVEGVVVWLDDSRAVKVKQDDYVELHRIVSNLSVKEVWRQLRAGTYDEFVVALPDEFHAWAQDTAAPLIAQHRDIAYAASLWLDTLEHKALTTRKDQALFITSKVPADMRGLVFSILDGKSIDDAVWRMVEPKADA